MASYDPFSAPDPDEWLAFDEMERIDMVERFHREFKEMDEAEGSERLHAVIHVVVENQIAMGEAPVPETVARLLRQGLDRHDAIHAIGAIVAEEMFGMLQGSQQAHDPGKYRRRLNKLTAKRWRKGRW